MRAARRYIRGERLPPPSQVFLFPCFFRAGSPGLPEPALRGAAEAPPGGAE
jgi:hypothetical protein